MDLSKLVDDYPEIETEIDSLNSEDKAHFRRLFAKRRQKLWPAMLVLAGLGIYCFVAGLWLNPGYSWILALLPTLFLTVFARSQIAGVISEKGQASKFYGLLSLPLVFAALCTLCGVLANFYFDTVPEYGGSQYHRQVVEDCQAGREDDKDECEYAEERLREAERREDREKPELLRGMIMSAVAIAAIYPISVYYLHSVVKKNNSRIIEDLLKQVKEKKPPASAPPGDEPDSDERRQA